MYPEILATYTKSEKKKKPAYATALKQLHSVSTDQLRITVVHCRGISVYTRAPSNSWKTPRPKTETRSTPRFGPFAVNHSLFEEPEPKVQASDY